MRPSASAPEVPAARQRQQSPPAISFYQPRRRRVWRAGPRKPPPATALGMLRSQLVASTSAIEHPARTPLEVNTKLHWLKGLQTRQAKAEELGQYNRDRVEEEMNVFTAQMDASFLITCGAVFINPVDRVTLLRLLSNLRKSHAPLEPSPLTEPEEPLASSGSLVRSPGSQVGSSVRAATKAPKPSSSAGPAAEALLSRTIKFAHERRRREEASPPRCPSTSRGSGSASRGGSAAIIPMLLAAVPEGSGDRRTREELERVKRQRALQKRICSRYTLQHLQTTHIQQMKRAADEAERIRAVRERVRMTLATAPSPVQSPTSANRLPPRSAEIGFFD